MAWCHARGMPSYDRRSGQPPEATTSLGPISSPIGLWAPARGPPPARAGLELGFRGWGRLASARSPPIAARRLVASAPGETSDGGRPAPFLSPRRAARRRRAETGTSSPVSRALAQDSTGAGRANRSNRSTPRTKPTRHTRTVAPCFGYPLCSMNTAAAGARPKLCPHQATSVLREPNIERNRQSLPDRHKLRNPENPTRGGGISTEID